MAKFNPGQYVEDVNKEIGTLYLALNSKDSPGTYPGSKRFNAAYDSIHSVYKGKIILTGGAQEIHCSMAGVMGRGYGKFVKVAQAEVSSGDEMPFYRALFVENANGIITLDDRRAAIEKPQTGSELFRLIRKKTGTSE